ncbi:ABC transporter ATP-binding protein [Ferrovibrio sp.]|uniref:ABC transporter ATP-binding protein n=1 Tax=Ferrovibrio sp. TaxID=1917215 RepID=UPI0025C54B7A|nr:ABC transporter ATP-binding protein [Ferrovibrio sp.]
MRALSIQGLQKSFVTQRRQVVRAISDFSLEVNVSEVIAVLGPSGCGKSSLLRILAGLDSVYSGTIDWPLRKSSDAKASGLQSATVFQSDSTFPWMNVRQNVIFGMTSLKIDRDAAAQRADYYLKLVGLEKFHLSYPHELSGGMRQRVCIARALATEPKLLLMDEPLAALDAQTRVVIQQELLRIWLQTKSTVIYITHDLGEALTLADRVVLMTARPGRIKTIRNIPFGRNRDAYELRGTPEFGELEVDLWRLLAEEVGQSLVMESR